MSAEWTNTQIIECEDSVGATVTVFRQSDGNRQRLVLGNGREVFQNPDGTISTPETQGVLNIASV